MGAKATKSPSNSEVSGKPHSLLRRIWEDDGPEGPRPLGLFGLVGRYKASTHQTHSRLVTTQLVFKTSVYVLCAPTDCKPPPTWNTGSAGCQHWQQRADTSSCCRPEWISDASSLVFPQLLSHSYLSSWRLIHPGTDSWDQSEMKKKQVWKHSKRA